MGSEEDARALALSKMAPCPRTAAVSRSLRPRTGALRRLFPPSPKAVPPCTPTPTPSAIALWGVLGCGDH
jgi:hypothetical protein